MLIVPMTGKMTWRNPPWITLLLILANCFIYFAFQAAENERFKKSIEYYFTSGLGEIEITHYLKYKDELPRGGRVTQEVIADNYYRMTHDAEFKQKLDNDQIIPVSSPIYSKWKSLKETFTQKQAEMTHITEKYGYTPATGNFKTDFTHMFLHGSVSHLLGNMLFLWLVGCSLELTGKRPAYLMIYLLTGMFAAFFFGLIYRGSTVPLVGASGAISGIIGAYTVFFGLRKVKIFISLGLYFNYTRVSAIFLLPVWIGNELFQLKWGGVSNVAYVAHLGGLTSGAALAFAQVKLFGGIKEDVFSDGLSEKVTSLVEKALDKLAVLDLEAARSFVQQALELAPSNRAALTCLFNVEKLDPRNENFHDAAVKLLLSLYREAASCEALFSLYKEYCNAASPPRLSPDMCAKLSQAFSDGGFLEDSRKLAGLLLSKSPQFPATPATLLKLSRAYLRSGPKEEGQKCLRLLCQRYPEAEESRLALEILKQTSPRHDLQWGQG
jgi:membrane associated rhomboid family serine protease